jgi:very-short-patch-repair endonuclease
MGMEHRVRGQRSEDRGQTTEDRGFKLLNIEQQNKEPQNDEVITSIRLRRILRFEGTATQMK